jgi:hypothetical protein
VNMDALSKIYHRIRWEQSSDLQFNESCRPPRHTSGISPPSVKRLDIQSIRAASRAGANHSRVAARARKGRRRVHC